MTKRGLYQKGLRYRPDARRERHGVCARWSVDTSNVREHPLTGDIYAIRDLYGSESALYNMTLSNAGLTPLGKIGSYVIVNSLFIR